MGSKFDLGVGSTNDNTDVNNVIATNLKDALNGDIEKRTRIMFDLGVRLANDNTCVNNEFATRLVQLALDAYKKDIVVQIKLGDKKKRKGKLNIAMMPAIVDAAYSTIMSEVAAYRARTCSTGFSSLFSVTNHEEILFVDYLLAMSLCYIEIDNPNYNPNVAYSQRVEKFYATRNINIARALCKLDSNKESKALNYLQTLESEYNNDSLRLLKISETKNGTYNMTQPRNAIKLGKNVRIMPLILIQALSKHIEASLMTGIMEFTYSKDDKTTRVLNSTLNYPIFMNYYKDNERWETVKGNVASKYTRGYIKIPELGLSRYDETGVRSLNLMRIEKMRRVDSVDISFIDVDINIIIPEFKKAVEEAYKNNKVNELYNYLMHDNKKMDKTVAREELLNWVDLQYTIGSTTFLRSLHNVMLRSKLYFPKYTGLKGSSSNYNVDEDLSKLFGDLGVE